MRDYWPLEDRQQFLSQIPMRSALVLEFLLFVLNLLFTSTGFHWPPVHDTAPLDTEIETTFKHHVHQLAVTMGVAIIAIRRFGVHAYSIELQPVT